MRLSLSIGKGNNIIRAYDEGYVVVNEQEIRQSVIITPEQIITDWPPQSFTELDHTHFEWLTDLAPEIVLLGTGRYQHFPPSTLTRRLLGCGMGVEVMDTAATCRTYNIIVAEGRRVAAALFMI